MIKIKITTTVPKWPLIRQTPGSKGIWKNCKFFVNDETKECDFWVVYEGLAKKEKVKCLRENTILITGEPPSIKKYDKKFLDQFGLIITCHRNIQHKNVIYQQQSQPWMVGGRFVDEKKDWEENFSKDFDELVNLNVYNKTKLISVIFSGGKKSRGHLARENFVLELKKHLGNNIDIFGVGHNPVVDKWDAIFPYKYHLAVENSSYQDYWTEKLSDSFLGGSYPIYYGCPNIYDYFPKNSLSIIDINEPRKSIEIIKKIVNNNKYEQSIDNIKKGKTRILYEYNLFPSLYEIVNSINKNLSNNENIVIFPEAKSFSKYISIKNYAKKIAGSFQGRILGKG